MSLPFNPPRALLISLLSLLALSSPAGEVQAGAVDGSWTYVIDKLIADGVDATQVRAVFRDPRVPPFDGLPFSIEPREPSSMYRKFRSAGSIDGARGCLDRHGAEFARAQRRFGVPGGLIAAILHVETHCGRNTGSQVILHRLARLAMAAEPANLQRNIDRHTNDVPPAERAAVEMQVRQRGRVLEEMFYPEVLGTFKLAERIRIDPLGIRGSGSGAFGLPQFLPSSYLRFAVDGDGNGRVSLYDPADAIASTANYLVGHGWRAGLSRDEQQRVIWEYNHSDSYIDAVLYLSDRLH